MKNILFVFYLFIIPVVIFVFCKKEEVINHETDITPVKKITRCSNGDEFIQFEYNNNETIKKVTIKNNVSTAGEVTSFNVTYNSDKSIKELTAADSVKIVAQYKDDLLSSADIIEHGKKVAFTNYDYENGNLKYISIYYNEEEGNIPVLKLIFNYNNSGNVTETTTLFAGGKDGNLAYAGNTKLKYNTNTNPLYQYKDILALFWQPASKNNVIAEDRYNKDQSLSGKYNYAYTYQNK
jgi:hypothetical protein